MGILNVTPDSFYSGSRTPDVASAVDAALSMVDGGAGVIDIGGESSRPGSDYVDTAEELERVVPVVRALRARSDVPISVDTRKEAVARAALDEGADIINDISALRDDPRMASLAAECNVPAILMHMRGTPKTMQSSPHYDDPVGEISDELIGFARAAEEQGVSNLVLDPGIGFGKRLSDNVAILAHIPQLKALGYPLLIGLSRKSFLGMILRDQDGTLRPSEDRLAASLAANAVAAIAGADILRVHDVRQTADLVRVIDAIRAVTERTEGSWTG
jgi:dihydropteroate synthase